MNARLTYWTAAAAGLSLVTTAGAQGLRRPNRIAIGPRAGFSIEANFQAAPALSGASPGPATGGGINRTYDDGYVGVDSSGNAGGQTWYWGYEHPAQVNPATDTLAMTALQGGTTPEISGVTDDPHVGVEISFQRVLGEFGGAYWGFDLGGTWTPVDLGSDTAFNASLTRITDVYGLGGITPPLAPYHGGFGGPGPTIGDSPTRTEVVQSVAISGDRKIESAMYGIRLGPMLEVPMGERLSLQIMGGVLLTYADSEFSYTERVVYPDSSMTNFRASASEQDWLLGGYVRGQLTLRFSERFGIYAAAQYEALSEIDLTAGSRSATLKPGGAIFGSAGVEYRF